MPADDEEAQMKGYLWRCDRKNCYRRWYLLKDRVLYEYRAPRDTCAITSLPILGFKFDTDIKVSNYFILLIF